MSIKYTFSINDDTLNGIVDAGRLTEDIQVSTITVALDYIAKEADDCDIWFKAALSGAEQTTLSGVIAAHTGTPLVLPGNVRLVDEDIDQITEVDSQNRLKVAIDPEPHNLYGGDHIGQLDDSQIPSYIIRYQDLVTLSGTLQDYIDNLDFYTTPEVDTISGSLQDNIDGKSDLDHIHDDRYYTEDEINTISGTLQDQLDGLTLDHGGLTGLGDDDHTQYHTDARGDARYYTKTLLDGGQLDDRYYTETEVDDLLDHGGLTGLDDDDHPQYLPIDGSRHVTGNLVIDGDLVVSGTEFIANTEIMEVEDNVIVVNKGELGAGVSKNQAGIEIDRGTLTNAFLVFDEVYDIFTAGISGSLQALATREYSPTNNYIAYWNDAEKRFDTQDGVSINDINTSGGIKYISFGDSSDDDLPATTMLKVVGGSTLGYVMPVDGKIEEVSVLTDCINSNNYNILKNNAVVYTLTLSSGIKGYDTSMSVPYIAGDILTAQMVTYSGVLLSDIDNSYISDSNTLFLAHFDGDDEVYRHVTNSSTTCFGMPGRRQGADLNYDGKFDRCVNFNGSSDYVEFLHHKDYDIQDVTVEFWFKADDIYNTQHLFSKDSSGYDTGGHLTIGLVYDDIYVRSQNTYTSKEIQFDPNITPGVWYHLAVVLGTGGIKVFLNGVLKSSDASWTQGLNGNREPFILGAGLTSNYDSYVYYHTYHFNGKIDELRISSTRRYESNFTPSTIPFTNDNDTLGLWHLDETDGNVVYDSSSIIQNAMMQTTGSMCTIETDYVKFGTNSIKMNNSKNDWLRLNHNSFYETSVLTVEGWIRPYCDDSVIFQKGNSSYTEGALQIWWKLYEQKIEVKYYGASSFRTITTATNSFKTNEWHHFSVTIDVDYIKVYVDGVEAGYEELTTDFQNVWNNNKDDIYIASTHCRNYYFEGYYDEIRISNSVRHYGSESESVKEINMLIGVE